MFAELAAISLIYYSSQKSLKDKVQILLKIKFYNMDKTIIIIDDHYFDVTDYLKHHPGGEKY